MSSNSVTTESRLYEVTPEAAKWRDISQQKQKYEKILKISMIAGGIVLLAGTALAFYFGATHLSGIDRIFCIVYPAVLGVPGGLAMIIVAICVNFERCQNGKTLSTEKTEEEAELIHMLTKGEYQPFHTKYYKRNGGLGPLVRKGFITSEHATQLRVQMEKYATHSKIVSDYKSQPRTKKKIEEGTEVPKGYTAALRGVEEVKAEWKILQKEFCSKYQDEGK